MAGFEPSKNPFFATSEKSMSGGYGSNLGYQRSHQMMIFSTTIPSGATRCLGSTLLSWWCNFTILKNIKIINGNNWVSDDIIWHPIDQKYFVPTNQNKKSHRPHRPLLAQSAEFLTCGSLELVSTWVCRDAVTPWLNRHFEIFDVNVKLKHVNIPCRLFIDQRSFSLYIESLSMYYIYI